MTTYEEDFEAHMLADTRYTSPLFLFLLPPLLSLFSFLSSLLSSLLSPLSLLSFFSSLFSSLLSSSLLSPFPATVIFFYFEAPKLADTL
jgi:hypothetical protein